MLSVPLFTAEALLRNRGMLLLVETADMISVSLFTAEALLRNRGMLYRHNKCI
jgi:hypothetical protein